MYRITYAHETQLAHFSYLLSGKLSTLVNLSRNWPKLILSKLSKTGLSGFINKVYGTVRCCGPELFIPDPAFQYKHRIVGSVRNRYGYRQKCSKEASYECNSKGDKLFFLLQGLFKKYFFPGTPSETCNVCS